MTASSVVEPANDFAVAGPALPAEPLAEPATPSAVQLPRSISRLQRAPSGVGTALRSTGRSGARVVVSAAYHVARLGPAGLVGIGASAGAAVLAFVAWVGIQRSTEDLAARLSAARHQPAIVRPQMELANVVSTLPGRDQMPAIVGQVLQQAVLAGISLTDGHYTYSPPAGGGVARYALEFPIKAQYPSIRDFINRTLATVPAAALDKLQIQRKAVGDSTVNANVQFVVFVRIEAGK